MHSIDANAFHCSCNWQLCTCKQLRTLHNHHTSIWFTTSPIKVCSLPRWGHNYGRFCKLFFGICVKKGIVIMYNEKVMLLYSEFSTHRSFAFRPWFPCRSWYHPHQRRQVWGTHDQVQASHHMVNPYDLSLTFRNTLQRSLPQHVLL